MIEMSKEVLYEIVEEDGMLLLDDMDDAIIGLASRSGQNTVVAYSIDKIIEILMASGMEYSKALEHYSFSIEGKYMGENTPIFIRLLT